MRFVSFWLNRRLWLANGYNILYSWSTGREVVAEFDRFSSDAQQNRCAPQAVAGYGRGRLDMLTNAIQLLRAALGDRSGISSLEYGVLAIAIIGGLAAVLGTLTSDINTLWTTLETTITNAT
jgi:Flp pilus assembly pilin Flp